VDHRFAGPDIAGIGHSHGGPCGPCRYPGLVGADTQLIRFADVGGRQVAWSSVGSGPPLVFGGWWCRSVELDWRVPAFRQFARLFTDQFTVIRYDRLPFATFEDELAILSTVVDQAGDQVTLFGGSSGSCVSAAYAATHPTRVERMVLYGPYARGTDIAPAESRESIVDIVGRDWRVGSRVLADLLMPDSTAQERDDFVRLERDCMTGEEAAHSMKALYGYDVRAHLAEIQAPTLVMHRREDRAIPFSLGRDVASRIPNASFVALEGVNHMPWVGDAEAVVHTALSFLGTTPLKSTVDTSELSSREIDVLRLVAQGLSDQEIAARLTLSSHTVHRHVANIRTKLGLASRTAAAAHAVRAGLI
jgi:pimeloyl-ACP methyl ester carboxylesterase/DNA-binding CsgD family transcriptional regulator